MPDRPEHPAPDEGLSLLASVMVIVAVFAIAVTGVVVLDRREEILAAGDAAGGARGQAEEQAAEQAREAGLRSSLATPSPTPLPEDSPGQHVVIDGESLFSVAADFGVTANELVFWNAGQYPTLHASPALREGWVLKVSGPPIATQEPPPTPIPLPAPSAGPEERVASIPQFGPGSFPASDRVTVSFYDVSGVTPQEIHEELEAGGPWSDWLGDNAQAHVHATVTYSFHFAAASDGSCDVVVDAPTPVMFHYEVRLPRWVDAVRATESTIEWWLEVIHETVWHEGHHIELYEAVLPAMNDAVINGSCDSVAADIETLLATANRANCEFDLNEYGYEEGLTLESCLAQ
jgi:predicted secreted Zn-dependent protease/LysM repeat protein